MIYLRGQVAIFIFGTPTHNFNFGGLRYRFSKAYVWGTAVNGWSRCAFSNGLGYAKKKLEPRWRNMTVLWWLHEPRLVDIDASVIACYIILQSACGFSPHYVCEIFCSFFNAKWFEFWSHVRKLEIWELDTKMRLSVRFAYRLGYALILFSQFWTFFIFNLAYSFATLDFFNSKILQASNFTTFELCSFPTLQLCNFPNWKLCNFATLRRCNSAILHLCKFAIF